MLYSCCRTPAASSMPLRLPVTTTVRRRAGMTHLTYLEAAVVGLFQGISEMFPVSSLGHSVLLPAIVGGFFSSIREGRVVTADQKLAWMIILATIPVGIVGLAFEHAFRVIFGKPILAGIFLAVNGVILLAGERYRTSASLAADAAIAAAREPAAALTAEGLTAEGLTAEGLTAEGLTAEGLTAGRLAAGPYSAGGQDLRRPEESETVQADARLALMSYPRAVAIGSAQILALLAGISRDGVTMVAGMMSLSRQDAARFAFLLATPVILAAGALKIPDLLGPLGHGIRGQIVLGSVLSGVGAYLAVRFLLRYLRTRSLTPFGVYCLVAGVASIIYLGLVK